MAPSVTLLCGGFGAARFLRGWSPSSSTLTCVVNTGDDHTHAGLLVSPDVDSVIYGLSGLFDEQRGWGRLDDTFVCADQLEMFGHGWFRVGDADLAVSLERTRLISAGVSMVSLTAAIASGLGVAATVLPMSERRVPTTVLTRDGAQLSLQEFLVRERAQPSVARVEVGSRGAAPASGVTVAIAAADLVVIAPSNPVSSISPILELEGVRELLGNRERPTIAISPVVCSVPPRTPPEGNRYHVREAFLRSVGAAHTPEGVAALYRGLIDGFVVDSRDEEHLAAVEACGSRTTTADTLASSNSDRQRLWDRVLTFGLGLG
jgi:LPPG:FO 2-phospho-L-lactate transferase